MLLRLIWVRYVALFEMNWILRYCWDMIEAWPAQILLLLNWCDVNLCLIHVSVVMCTMQCLWSQFLVGNMISWIWLWWETPFVLSTLFLILILSWYLMMHAPELVILYLFSLIKFAKSIASKCHCVKVIPNSKNISLKTILTSNQVERMSVASRFSLFTYKNENGGHNNDDFLSQDIFHL
jgi:hypothetical protein